MALLTRLSDALRRAVKVFPGGKAAQSELGQLLQTLAALHATVTVNDGNTQVTLASGVSLELTGTSARLRLVGGADLFFDGTNNQNKIILADNLAAALEIQDASGNDLVTFGTTTGQLAMTVDAILTASQQSQFTGARGIDRVIPVSATPHTVAITDSGKIFYTTIADVVFNLPDSAVDGLLTGLTYTFVNGSLSGGTGLSVSPAATDQIQGKGITPEDAKDYINSGASDALGDLITIHGMTDGWLVSAERGTWARQA
jgi:hypothetical protein